MMFTEEIISETVRHSGSYGALGREEGRLWCVRQALVTVPHVKAWQTLAWSLLGFRCRWYGIFWRHLKLVVVFPSGIELSAYLYCITWLTWCLENRRASWCGYLCNRHYDTVFIIIIIRHELVPNRLLSTLSNGLFKALCVHLVYNSAFSCCSCLLLVQSLLCGSQNLDHVAAYHTILDHPDPDEGFMGNTERCVGAWRRARCVSTESNCESCNSYLFFTHALCDSGGWVWLGGYFVVCSRTVAEDRSVSGMW